MRRCQRPNVGSPAVTGIAPLKELLRRKLERENGTRLDESRRLVVTAGGNMAFMNAVLAPAQPGAWNDIRDGIKVTRALPSGSYEFVAGHIDGIGTILNCSLFSPMP